MAYRSEGGRTVVVLCKREKLEMEDMFRRTIPEVARYGTRFVFRQVRSFPANPTSVARASGACHWPACPDPPVTCKWMPDICNGLHGLLMQGSPLVPDDLRMVSASQAAAICVISDTSRCEAGRMQAHLDVRV